MDPLATLRAALDALAEIADPAERAKVAGEMLRAIPAAQTRMNDVRHQAVTQLRAQGLSHAKVAELLDVSRSRAQQLAEGSTTYRRTKGEGA